MASTYNDDNTWQSMSGIERNVTGKRPGSKTTPWRQCLTF